MMHIQVRTVQEVLLLVKVSLRIRAARYDKEKQ